MRSLVITISGIAALILIIIGNVAQSIPSFGAATLLTVIAITLTVTDRQSDRRAQ